MNRQEQEQLLADFVQGTASDIQLAQLKQEIHTHPKLKQSLAEMLLVEQMLFIKHEDSNGELLKNEVLHALNDDSSGRHFTKETIDQIRSQQQKTNRKATRSHRRKRSAKKQDPLWIAIGVAAALVCIVIAAWPSPTPTPVPEKPEIVKEVITPKAPAQIGEWKQFLANNLIHPKHADQRSTRCFIGDQLQTTQDTVLVLDDASEITIHADSHVEIQGDDSRRLVFLHSGSIKAHITKQENGSAILFPTSYGTARIVGTAFLLNSDNDGSRLEVYSGRIEQSHTQRQEKVFVDAGHYVDIIPDHALEVKPIAVAVQAPKPQVVIKEKPEPIIIPEVPQIEKPFFEWSTKDARAWIRGNLTNEAIDAHEDFEQHVIYARLPQAQRQTLRQNDEFHFTLRCAERTDISIDIFLADQNQHSPSHLQFATYTYSVEHTDAWVPISFTLADLPLPHKKFIDINQGCFAIRLRTARAYPFAVQRALIKRPPSEE